MVGNNLKHWLHNHKTKPIALGYMFPVSLDFVTNITRVNYAVVQKLDHGS